jgi:hypothetical protein
MIGHDPVIDDGEGGRVVLPGALAAGFIEEDADTLGNWQRDVNARNESSAALAAAQAPEAQARRAAALASLPGRRSQRGAMRVYYGQGGSTHNRFGQRFKLLSARQRLVRTVRAILGTRDWRFLPRGQADLALLKSVPAGT